VREKLLGWLKTAKVGNERYGYLPRVESAAVISDNEMQNLTKLFTTASFE
jgi:hypothetical protein